LVSLLARLKSFCNLGTVIRGQWVWLLHFGLSSVTSSMPSQLFSRRIIHSGGCRRVVRESGLCCWSELVEEVWAGRILEPILRIFVLSGYLVLLEDFCWQSRLITCDTCPRSTRWSAFFSYGEFVSACAAPGGLPSPYRSPLHPVLLCFCNPARKSNLLLLL